MESKTQIVATVGPASGTKEIISKMIAEGMNVGRFNFSHGTHASQSATFARVREFRLVPRWWVSGTWRGFPAMLYGDRRRGGHVTSSSTTIGDRRASAAERRLAQRRHPSQRDGVKAATPPPLAYYLIAGVVLVLTMLGLVMVFAATSIAQLHKGNSPWRIFNRQFMWAICGGFGLWAAVSTPMRKWRRFVGPALIGSYGLALLPFVPSIGNRVNSASSWVAISGFSFQPSEFVKLAVLLAAADLLGFSGASAFSRWFVTDFGKRPSDWRKDLETAP